MGGTGVVLNTFRFITFRLFFFECNWVARLIVQKEVHERIIAIGGSKEIIRWWERGGDIFKEILNFV